MKKLAAITVAAALALPAVGAFAAQQFGRDSVYAEAGRAASTTAPRAEITRFGRDSVYVTKDARLSKPTGVAANQGFTFKPGRA